MPHVLHWGAALFHQNIADLWTEDCLYSSPPNAEGYAAASMYGTFILFEIPADATATASRTMREFLVANPDTTDSKWCANSPDYAVPYRYVGHYTPSTAQGPRALSEDKWNCPHCALAQGRTICAVSGRTRNLAVMLTSPTRQIPNDYKLMNNSPEVLGESDWGTETIQDYKGPPGYACGNCGRLGHNSRACCFGTKHFDRIGVEVEGRFLDLRAKKLLVDQWGGDSASDGSIHTSPDSGAEPWELKTKAGSLREAIEQVVAFYPDETDKSCGMHVHMSFPQDCLTLLHTRAFFAYFRKRWEAWGTAMRLDPAGEFFQRLNGDNDYCLTNDSPRRNMSVGERYEQLNFTAWRGHKTLECRLLPMFRRSSLAVAAIQELVSIYEDFLVAPEMYGVVYEDLQDVAVDVALCGPLPVSLDSLELETLPVRLFEMSHEIELSEMPPCAENMVRIALPVNQPITVEALSGRLQALRAA